MFLLSLFISWKCSNKKCDSEIGKFTVPLEYWREPTQNLTLKVSRSIKKSNSIPVFILGPGMGRTNIAKSYDSFSEYFPDTSFYMVGYRGVDSDPSFSNNDIKSLVSISEAKIDDDLISRIANKTLGRMNISEFWVPQRARDVIEFMKSEGISKANILAVGETGSLVCHQLLSDYPLFFDKTVIVGSSVPSDAHTETSVRLLGTYRRLCRKDPANCPYQNIRWLPENIPDKVLLAFKVSKERVRYAIEQQLRVPSTAPVAFDILQSITDNSKMGYMAFNTIPGPEVLSYKWIDVAMHMCSEPFDKSFFAPSGIKHICPRYPKFSTTFKNKFTNPILLIIGELDLPREKYVLEFYRNNSVSPSLIDHVFLNKSSSLYEFGREDVSKLINEYFVTGKADSPIDQNVTIIWKSGVSLTSMMKWIIGVTGVSTVVLCGVMFRKESNEDRKQKTREKWMKQHQNEEAARMQQEASKPKKQQKQTKAKRE